MSCFWGSGSEHHKQTLRSSDPSLSTHSQQQLADLVLRIPAHTGEAHAIQTLLAAGQEPSPFASLSSPQCTNQHLPFLRYPNLFLSGEAHAIQTLLLQGKCTKVEAELAGYLLEVAVGVRELISRDPEGLKKSLKEALHNNATANWRELSRVSRFTLFLLSK